MLRIYKNEAVTKVARQQMEIRQMELDWYSTNYDTMAMQAALFAGFAFEQLTEPCPEGTHWLMEVIYTTLICATLGLEVCVCMSCTLCCVYGKGLALRGPEGAKSIHAAVDSLEAEQNCVFSQFFGGIVCYLVGHAFQMWIYFRPRVAFTACVPLIVFLIAILYYVYHTVSTLVLDDKTALKGQFAFGAQYDIIQDLDAVSEDRDFHTTMPPGQTI